MGEGKGEGDVSYSIPTARYELKATGSQASSGLIQHSTSPQRDALGLWTDGRRPGVAKKNHQSMGEEWLHVSNNSQDCWIHCPDDDKSPTETQHLLLLR